MNIQMVVTCILIFLVLVDLIEIRLSNKRMNDLEERIENIVTALSDNEVF